MPSDIVLFNPMPVKHSVAVVNKMTTSLQVPLVNILLSLLALARMVTDDFTVAIINAPVDANYTDLILDACRDALCFGVSSMTCYQIRDGLNVSAAVKERYPDLPTIPLPNQNRRLRTPISISWSGGRARSHLRRL